MYVLMYVEANAFCFSGIDLDEHTTVHHSIHISIHVIYKKGICI